MLLWLAATRGHYQASCHGHVTQFSKNYEEPSRDHILSGRDHASRDASRILIIFTHIGDSSSRGRGATTPHVIEQYMAFSDHKTRKADAYAIL